MLAKKISLWLLTLTALLGCHKSWGVAQTERMQMRGERYCEVLISDALTSFQVYNTFGLNKCPEALWKKVTIGEVKSQTQARIVHLNGPRYWVIDGLKNSSLIDTTIKNFAGLAMRHAGTLKISLIELLSAKPYQKHRVDRHTTWVYSAGRPVYELIDPEQHVYVMQSYSVQNNLQTPKSLTQLGAKLHLPKGWQFKTGILKKTEYLPAVNDVAVVIQDDFQNTYQLAEHDFLSP